MTTDRMPYLHIIQSTLHGGLDRERIHFYNERYSEITKRLKNIVDIVFDSHPEVKIRARARLFLQHYRWNAEKVHKYLLRHQYDEFVVFPGFGRRSEYLEQGKFACTICGEENEMAYMALFECLHPTCETCFAHYARKAIIGGANAIRCPAPDCVGVIDDDTVIELLTSSEDISRFKKNIVDMFVTSQADIKPCPVYGCRQVIRIRIPTRNFDLPYPEKALFDFDIPPHLHSLNAECFEGHRFCFACRDPVWHFPLGCDLWERWTRECHQQGESFNSRMQWLYELPFGTTSSNVCCQNSSTSSQAPDTSLGSSEDGAVGGAVKKTPPSATPENAPEYFAGDVPGDILLSSTIPSAPIDVRRCPGCTISVMQEGNIDRYATCFCGTTFCWVSLEPEIHNVCKDVLIDPSKISRQELALMAGPKSKPDDVPLLREEADHIHRYYVQFADLQRITGDVKSLIKLQLRREESVKNSNRFITEKKYYVFEKLLANFEMIARACSMGIVFLCYFDSEATHDQALKRLPEDYQELRSKFDLLCARFRDKIGLDTETIESVTVLVTLKECIQKRIRLGLSQGSLIFR